MEIGMLILLVLLQIKHWYVDFVNQSTEEVASKGNYGDFHGIMHSLKHGIGTLICVLMIVGPEFALFALALSLIDFVTHYHIDWVKMNYGNRDIQNPLFWNHLGLDQMAHQIVYLLIALLVVI
jgi:hypothetical protein